MISNNKWNRLVLKNGEFFNIKNEQNYSNIFNYLGNIMGIDIDNIYNNTSSEGEIKRIHGHYSIDLEEYKNNNNDLLNLSDDKLTTHYKNRSLIEGRVINKEFLYKINYPLYNSGTVFAMRGNILYNTICLETIKKIEMKLIENKEFGYIMDSHSATLTHGLERFIGLLNYYLGYDYFGI